MEYLSNNDYIKREQCHAKCMSGLALLAAGKLDEAKKLAHSWNRLPGSGVWVWPVGYQCIFLSEYYLVSKDETVLKTIQGLATRLAMVLGLSPSRKSRGAGCVVAWHGHLARENRAEWLVFVAFGSWARCPCHVMCRTVATRDNEKSAACEGCGPELCPRRQADLRRPSVGCRGLRLPGQAPNADCPRPGRTAHGDMQRWAVGRHAGWCRPYRPEELRRLASGLQPGRSKARPGSRPQA